MMANDGGCGSTLHLTEISGRYREDISVSHPDWSNVLKELGHFINGDGLSESCDVDGAVLRVILLLRASWSGNKMYK